MRRTILATALLVAIVPFATPAIAHAQVTPAAGVPRPANDSIFRRARKLVLDGNGVAGRALVDSLLAAAPAGSSAYGDALYWHGALATTLAEAERDYRRVIVEFPLAYFADDALLALAELEQARGDRAGALAHLLRFVHDHPASPGRGIAALGAARLAFEQRDTTTACAMITEARASIAPGDVELTNQIAFFSARCPAVPRPAVATMGSVATPAATRVDTQSAATKTGAARVTPDPLPATPAERRPDAPVPTAPVKAPVKAPVTAPAKAPATAPVKAAVKAPAAAHGRYTIQLAAYNTRPDAQKLVTTLATKGITARVSGDVKPFRVRLGFYPTRSAAATQVALLKARGIVGFVAEEAPAP